MIRVDLDDWWTVIPIELVKAKQLTTSVLETSTHWMPAKQSYAIGALYPRHTEGAVPLRCLYGINRSEPAMIAVVPQWYRH